MKKRFPELVLCPCCNEILYKTIPEGTGPIVIHRGVGSNPELKQDDRGLFMKCDHCLKRITFRQLLVEGRKAPTYEVTYDQNCQ